MQITPGSLKAVWVLEGGEKYELSENLGRDITNSGGATIGKDSLNTLVIQGGNSGQRSTVRVPEGGEYRVVLSDGTKAVSYTHLDVYKRQRWWDLVRFDKAFELVPSLAGRDNQELLYFPIPNSVLSLEPLVEPNSAWPM